MTAVGASKREPHRHRQRGRVSSPGLAVKGTLSFGRCGERPSGIHFGGSNSTSQENEPEGGRDTDRRGERDEIERQMPVEQAEIEVEARP